MYTSLVAPDRIPDAEYGADSVPFAVGPSGRRRTGIPGEVSEPIKETYDDGTNAASSIRTRIYLLSLFYFSKLP
jgi:hypothetical protein